MGMSTLNGVKIIMGCLFSKGGYSTDCQNCMGCLFSKGVVLQVSFQRRGLFYRQSGVELRGVFFQQGH